MHDARPPCPDRAARLRRAFSALARRAGPHRGHPLRRAAMRVGTPALRLVPRAHPALTPVLPSHHAMTARLGLGTAGGGGGGPGRAVA